MVLTLDIGMGVVAKNVEMLIRKRCVITDMKIVDRILDFILDHIGNVPDKCKGCGSRTPPWTLPDGTPCEEDCFFKNR